MARTTEQRRAKHAWNAVQRAKASKGAREYFTHAKKLPVRIMTAGLGQALTFVHSKGNAQNLLQDIADWVLDKKGNINSSSPPPKFDVMISAITDRDSSFLRIATNETLTYLQWLNRFADAEGLTDEDQ